jgi:hypothetical protein
MFNVWKLSPRLTREAKLFVSERFFEAMIFALKLQADEGPSVISLHEVEEVRAKSPYRA